MPLENNNRLNLLHYCLFRCLTIYLSCSCISNSELRCKINEQAMYDDLKKNLFNLFRLVFSRLQFILLSVMVLR